MDSMILTDLIHLAGTTSEPIVVVSGDDDLWPGMRFVLLQGKALIQMVPSRAGASTQNYSHLHTSRYVRLVV